MFQAVKNRWFVAKVQAEIMAQHDDQHFVNHICQLPNNIEQLIFMNEHAYFRRDAVAPFIAACHVLCESLSQAEVSDQHKIICAGLLAQRLQKVSSNAQFRLKYLMIFGKMEEDFANWAQANGMAGG
jgi:hypothetical protein